MKSGEERTDLQVGKYHWVEVLDTEMVDRSGGGKHTVEVGGN